MARGRPLCCAWSLLPSRDCSSSSWHGAAARICIHRISSKFCRLGMQLQGCGAGHRGCGTRDSRDPSPGHGDQGKAPIWLPGLGDTGGTSRRDSSTLFGRGSLTGVTGMGRAGDSGLGGRRGGIVPVERELVTAVTAAGGAGRAAQHLLLPEAWPHPRAINSWHGSPGQRSARDSPGSCGMGNTRQGGWGPLLPQSRPTARSRRSPALSPSWERLQRHRPELGHIPERPRGRNRERPRSAAAGSGTGQGLGSSSQLRR